MMVGLQGSGKTTTHGQARPLVREAGQIAAARRRRHAAPRGRRAAEGTRAAAVHPVFNIEGGTPLEICSAAREEAKKQNKDVIIYDTAGRLAIDEALMEELKSIKSAVAPQNIFLVIDAMIGQDSVKTARGFNDR